MAIDSSVQPSTTTTPNMVTGLFRTREDAERAWDVLASRGYTRDDISVMVSDEARGRHFGEGDADTDLGSKALEGAGVGSAVGGTIGAIVAAVAAVRTNLVLPGLGLIVAGPLAAGLAGAGAGGLTGGLIGALVGAGFPEERARFYDQGIREGAIVLGVKPRSADDAAYFEREWRNARGEQVWR